MQPIHSHPACRSICSTSAPATFESLPYALLHAALRVDYKVPLEIDPSRSCNEMCLINDFTGVPGAEDGPNSVFLEMEDRWHSNYYTFNVQGGQLRP